MRPEFWVWRAFRAAVPVSTPPDSAQAMFVLCSSIGGSWLLPEIT